ncbi:TspO/MBR family protein [Coraliomargarita akajimensis]|uniref:TspO and MBR like protein n=1 Tax=Coraliomargarita akajimensis (strain DSM 45221 / IAM 15411 / JCM 23193 / KCTC 12865 / 04OKA010-24) TaxID=583355 RepID=D5EQ01_CORAD|nr:TspO/MBR family protein [Coraliomargarita akajimensis]ADE55734.1 TspO and MBR like protein [Coraliomargarita akajimensis DSM 45221]
MQFWKKAVLCVLTVEVLGNLSGVISVVGLDGWYASLQRPAGTPPNAVFGPVWMVIYALIGIAWALVWDTHAAKRLKRPALAWFGVQLVLNLLWSPAFFALQRTEVALVIILSLLGAIIITLLKFWRINVLAALFMIPYLLWVSYASYLNLGFWWLNR